MRCRTGKAPYRPHRYCCRPAATASPVCVTPPRRPSGSYLGTVPTNSKRCFFISSHDPIRRDRSRQVLVLCVAIGFGRCHEKALRIRLDGRDSNLNRFPVDSTGWHGACSSEDHERSAPGCERDSFQDGLAPSDSGPGCLWDSIPLVRA
jgi:hypothetical protein